jgi:gamma-glutamylcyclotransferase (GGCT)/AIG2-like uncharacterized protein YtfP
MRTERVFVYGILLRRNEATPPGSPASMYGYRLAFDGGLATVIPAPGEHVEGALLDVTPEELRGYDSIEGYRPEAPERGLYRRERVRVDTPNDEEECWVYIKNTTDGAWAPSLGMLTTIHAGYIAWGLDADRLEEAIDRAHAGKEVPA